MADKRITELPELTAVTGADVLEIVDSSDPADSVAGSSRRVTVDNLLAGRASASGLAAHLADTANPHAVTAAQAGAYTTAEVDGLLADYAPLASPALTGTPTAPTAAGGTDTTQVATTAFVTAAVAAAGGGTGTVTAVAVATANGLAGTSDADPDTPTLTLSTTVTGLLKGDGTAIGAATPGTDYVAPAALADYLTTADAATAYQPLDADLTGLAGLSSTGFVRRTGAGAFSAASLASGDIPDLSATYATTASLSSYLTTATAASTYAPIASPSFTGRASVPAHYGAFTSDADGATVTFDMAVSDKHTVTLGGNRTLAFSNFQAGQVALVELVQDATGGRSVTWPTIRWSGGTAPTLTTTAGKADLVTVVKLADGTLAGAVSIPNY